MHDQLSTKFRQNSLGGIDFSGDLGNFWSIFQGNISRRYFEAIFEPDHKKRETLSEIHPMPNHHISRCRHWCCHRSHHCCSVPSTTMTAIFAAVLPLVVDCCLPLLMLATITITAAATAPVSIAAMHYLHLCLCLPFASHSSQTSAQCITSHRVASASLLSMRSLFTTAVFCPLLSLHLQSRRLHLSSRISYLIVALLLSSLLVCYFPGGT